MSVNSCLNICSFAFRTCHISLSIPLGKGELGKVIKCDIVCVSSIQKIAQLSLCRASQPWNCSFDVKFIFCYPLFKRFIQLSWYLFDNHLFAYSKQYCFFGLHWTRNRQPLIQNTFIERRSQLSHWNESFVFCLRWSEEMHLNVWVKIFLVKSNGWQNISTVYLNRY